MKCQTCQNLIYDFIDKTLPPGKESRILQHLEKCPVCSHVLEKEQRTSSFLKTAFDIEASQVSFTPSDAERIRNAIRTKPKESYVTRLFPAILKPAAATAVLVIGVLTVLSVRKDRPQDRLVPSPLSPAVAQAADEDPALADPLEDWQHRRLILTIIDENQKRHQKIITPPREVVGHEEREEKGELQ